MSKKKQRTKKKQGKQPGPPPVTLHIDDKPENIAKGLFGIPSPTPGKITFKRDKQD